MVTLTSRDAQVYEDIYPQDVSLKINAIATKSLLINFFASLKQNELRSSVAELSTISAPSKPLSVGWAWANRERTASAERAQIHPRYQCNHRYSNAKSPQRIATKSFDVVPLSLKSAQQDYRLTTQYSKTVIS